MQRANFTSSHHPTVQAASIDSITPNVGGLSSNNVSVSASNSNNVSVIANSDNVSTIANNVSTTANSNNVSLGNTIYIDPEPFASGAFGVIYKAKDNTGRQLAIKRCPVDRTGINNLLEASIMASFNHKYINSCLEVYCTPKYLYIIQDIAVCNLMTYRHSQVKGSNPTLVRSWAYQLCQAILALHNENIVHADIKASNILLYPDYTIKLTDFTLATQVLSLGQTFTHSICTSTHRPPEGFLSQPWDKAADIWSLGCTLYEISRGELLFPGQKFLNELVDKEEVKKRFQSRNLSCFRDWGCMTNQCIQDLTDCIIEDIVYNRIHYLSSEDHQYDNLMLSTLMIAPNKRPDINTICQSRVFSGLANVEYSILGHHPVRSEGEAKLRLRKLCSQSFVVDLACKIYSQCPLTLDEVNLMDGCMYIASKICRVDVKLPTLKSELLNIERQICHSVGFRLLP